MRAVTVLDMIMERADRHNHGECVLIDMIMENEAKAMGMSALCPPP